MEKVINKVSIDNTDIPSGFQLEQNFLKLTIVDKYDENSLILEVRFNNLKSKNGGKYETLLYPFCTLYLNCFVFVQPTCLFTEQFRCRTTRAKQYSVCYGSL